MSSPSKKATDKTVSVVNKSATPLPTNVNLRIGVLTIILSVAAYYASRNSKQLPDTYALCSPHGRRIYTVDNDNTLVECILIQNSRIADTGDLAVIKENTLETVGSASFPIRYIPSGSIVIPGISDSHCHILEYGASRQIPLSAGRSAKETVLFVREYITKHPDLKHNKSRVVEGWGWDHASWDIEQWPSWEDLEVDPMIAGRPVILQSRDGHALWVSKKTLLDNGPYPDIIDGGVIFRDKAGNPTGIFMDSAQDLIKRLPPSRDELDRRFRTTVGEALAAGLTSLHDAGFKPDSLAFLNEQAKQGALPIRIYGMTFFDEYGQYWGDQIKPFVAAPNERLSARSVKIFADGALRTGGAALYEPYSDNPSTSGAMRISTEVLSTIIPRFLKDGWQVNVHAIGDRANGIVLDVFEASLKAANVSALRPRLEHAQIMTKADMIRLGDLGVIASIQPTHVYVTSQRWCGFPADHYTGLIELAICGSHKTDWDLSASYAFRSILESGARITLGSDFPVEEINPLKGFYAAVTRLATDGTSPHGPQGWFPEQTLTRIEALRGMTIDPAYASFTEDSLGSLVPGKRADYVILSQDIMTIPSSDIMNTKVIATLLDGRPVFGKV